MPASGPVYQPTTVGYEQQNEWSRPGSYLSQTMSHGLRSPRCLQWVMLAFSIFTLAVGLIMVVEGRVQLADTPQEAQHDSLDVGPTHDTGGGGGGGTTDVVITVLGAFLIIVGLLLMVVYVRLMQRRRKGCPCFPGKEQRLARQLDTQATNGQILTLNPSTDLLVAAQYGPVSEIAYQPTAVVSDEEETRKLMPADIKDSTEESDRMLEPDPRIVLRPLSHAEEA